MTAAASLRDTLFLAHTASCKLQLAVDSPDRNLRFILGHALTLDSLTLRLVEIDDDMARSAPPAHASGVGSVATTTGSAQRAKSAPPWRDGHEHEHEHKQQDAADTDLGSEGDQHGLALTRLPPATARKAQPPPRTPAEPQPPAPATPDGPLSSGAEGPVEREPPDEDVVRRTTSGSSDELLLRLYSTVRNCPCHGYCESGPRLRRMWEVQAAAAVGEERVGGDGVGVAVGEVGGGGASEAAAAAAAAFLGRGLPWGSVMNGEGAVY